MVTPLESQSGAETSAHLLHRDGQHYRIDQHRIQRHLFKFLDRMLVKFEFPVNSAIDMQDFASLIVDKIRFAIPLRKLFLLKLALVDGRDHALFLD